MNELGVCIKCFLEANFIVVGVYGMLQMCFGCSHTTKICKRKNVLLTYFLHSNEDMKTNRKKQQQHNKCDNTSLLSDFREMHEVVLQLMIASNLPLKPLPAVLMHPFTAGASTHPGVCYSVQAPPSVSNLREGGQIIR